MRTNRSAKGVRGKTIHVVLPQEWYNFLTRRASQNNLEFSEEIRRTLKLAYKLPDPKDIRKQEILPEGLRELTHA